MEKTPAGKRLIGKRRRGSRDEQNREVTTTNMNSYANPWETVGDRESLALCYSSSAKVGHN